MRSAGVNILDAVKKRAVPMVLAQAILDADMVCECGAELEFDSTMRNIRCSNEDCICRKRAEAVNSLMFLGASIEEIAALKDRIYAEIDKDSKCGCNILLSEDEEIGKIIDKYIADEMQLSEILGLTGISILTTSSSSIMQGYRSVGELFDDLHKNEAVVLARRLYLEHNIAIAYKLASELDRCEGVLIPIERQLNVIVKRDTTIKRAGTAKGSDNYIGVPTDENADVVVGRSSNKLYDKLVEGVDKKRERKGLSAIQNL